MVRMRYKKFVVIARAYPLQGHRGWSAEFDLEESTGDSVILTPFAIMGTYPSEESALESALLHGRKKIDDGFGIEVGIQLIEGC